MKCISYEHPADPSARFIGFEPAPSWAVNIRDEIPKMHLELEAYKKFVKEWNSYSGGHLRYGQAFHSYFRLDKIVSKKDVLDQLYQLDGDEARSLIHELFEFN